MGELQDIKKKLRELQKTRKIENKRWEKRLNNAKKREDLLEHKKKVLFKFDEVRHKIKHDQQLKFSRQLFNAKTEKGVNTIKAKIEDFKFIPTNKRTTISGMNRMVKEERKENTEKKKTIVRKMVENHRNKIVFEDNPEISTAFKKKVMQVNVKTKRVGKNVALDMLTHIQKSVKEALKSVPKDNTDYVFRTVTSIPRADGNGDWHISSKSFRKDNIDDWAHNVAFNCSTQNNYVGGAGTTSSTTTVQVMSVPVGGSYVFNEELESVLSRKTVKTMKNTDNACFWYSMLACMSLGNRVESNKYKYDGQHTPTKNQAMEIAQKCGYIFDMEVSFADIPDISEKLDCNIYILDIRNLPPQRMDMHLYNNFILIGNDTGKKDYYLLHDGESRHFHVITDIRKFFDCDHFCSKCCRTFRRKTTYDEHFKVMCTNSEDKRKTQVKVRDDTICKDLKGYMYGEILKGSKEEILELKKRKNSEKAVENVIRPKYIIYDFETDCSTNISKVDGVHVMEHRPMHVEVEVIKPDLNHTYEGSLIQSNSFTGYDCTDDFCKWLFTPENVGATVIAHNGGGYDNKFILKWCLKHGMCPSKYIRQGSSISYMQFRKYNIRFIDSLRFFAAPLRKLPSMFGIKNIEKGHFPHKFNRPENQNYVGKIPPKDDFGYTNMKPEEAAEFHEWYDNCSFRKTDNYPMASPYETVKDEENWDFKAEMIKYCKDDVRILSKSILEFRKIYINQPELNVDPFRYITIASLCVNIFLTRFHSKTENQYKFVQNDSNKPISRISREWFIDLGLGNDIKREYRLPPIDVSKIPKEVLNSGKIDGCKIINYKNSSHVFHVDGYDSKTNTVYEFNGCFYHGCRKCYPKHVVRYNKTVERKNIIKSQGYKFVEIDECEFNNKKDNMSYKIRDKIEYRARNEHVNIRDCLFGGRTEGFKSYSKAGVNSKILYFDIVSLYPTVNALDEYAVGFKTFYTPTVEEIIDGSFVGVCKCKITPPNDLHIPVLPSRGEMGKLTFDLLPKEGTWTSIELKNAVEHGYVINEVYGGFKYKKYTGVMKQYVEYFLKMKTCKGGERDTKQCDELNEAHKNLGLNINIKPEETSNNPGMKAIAKLCLNSLWGKFGQRQNMESFEFYRENEYTQLVRKILDDKVFSKSWDIINEDIVELRYCMQNDTPEPDMGHINEIAAAFTTANARKRLYNFMSWFHPTQVIYCDTDSCVVHVDFDNKNHKIPYNENPDLPKGIHFGSALGDWESEMDDFASSKYIFKKSKNLTEDENYELQKRIELVKENKDHMKSYETTDWISEIVVGGAKSYAYKTFSGKIVVKLKGITLDQANSEVFNFDSMKDMILNDKTLDSKIRYMFKWDSKTKDVVTKYIKKSLRNTLDSKREIIGYDTLPFGYGLRP